MGKKRARVSTPRAEAAPAAGGMVSANMVSANMKRVLEGASLPLSEHVFRPPLEKEKRKMCMVTLAAAKDAGSSSSTPTDSSKYDKQGFAAALMEAFQSLGLRDDYTIS
jgi:hypothetical protein